MAQYNLGIQVSVNSTESIDQLRRIQDAAKKTAKETADELARIDNERLAKKTAAALGEDAAATARRLATVKADRDARKELQDQEAAASKKESVPLRSKEDASKLQKIKEEGQARIDEEEGVYNAVEEVQAKHIASSSQREEEGGNDRREKSKKSGKARLVDEEEAANTLRDVQTREITATRKLLDTGVIDQKTAIERINKVRGDGTETQVVEKAGRAINQIKEGGLKKELAITEAGLKDIETRRVRGEITTAQAEQESGNLRLTALKQRLAIARQISESGSGKEKSDATARVIKLEASIELEEAKGDARRSGNRKKSRSDRLSNDQNADGNEKRQRALTLEEIEAKEAASAIKILQIKIKAIEDEQTKSLALLKIAEQERLNLIQDGLNKQTLRKEDADAARLQTARTALENELAFAREAQNKLSQLSASNPKAQEELEKKKLEAAQKTAALTGKLLENEAAQQEFYRARAIAGIEKEQDARTKAIDLQIAQGAKIKTLRENAATIAELASNKEIAAINRVVKSMETQTKLSQARNSLEKARLDGALFLAEKSGDPNAIAAVKLAQFAEEQRQQQVNLANQIKLENLANRRSVIEAKINELKAKQAVLTAQQAIAEAALTAAKAKGEADSALAKANQLAPGEAKDKAIAAAKQQQALAAESATAQKSAAATGLEVAKQGVELAAQATQDLQSQIATQKEVQATQQQTLNLEQQTAKARFDSEQAIARQNALLQQQQGIQQNIANAAQQTAENRGGGGASLPGRRMGGSGRAGNAYIVGEVEPEIFVPGASGWFLNQDQIAANLNRFTQARAIAGLPMIGAGSPGVESLLKEIKELKHLIASRSPIVNMPVTFSAPDSNEWDSVLKIQRSNLRGML